MTAMSRPRPRKHRWIAVEAIVLAAVWLAATVPARLAAAEAAAEGSTENPPTETASTETAWRQWGGPRHDFSSDGANLATSWPESGPKLLWQRPLGEGYSGIVAENGRLYTLWHDDGDEVAIAIDAASGKTIWERRYPAQAPDDMNLEYGPGPHATPALAGDRLFTAGATLKVHAFDKATGEVCWSRDLVADLGVSLQQRGYAASPLVYEDLVIVTPGGAGTAVVALYQADGKVAWKSQSFRPSYSSPILARVGGEDQVIVAMGPDRAGLDPRTGELEWRLTLRGEASNIMSTQIFGPDDVLFGSAAYTDGSRALKIAKKNGQFVAEELWFSTRMRIQHSTAVRFGDRIYGSSGDFGPPVLAAIDVHTGELLFRQRGFGKSNLLAAGRHVLILDEDGVLAIGTPRDDGIEIHAQAQVLDGVAWTVPTLVGTRLYVRDRKTVKAFDLGS